MIVTMLMDYASRVSPGVWRIVDVNVCLYMTMGFSYPVSDLLIAGLRKLVVGDDRTNTTKPDSAAAQGRNGWRFADWDPSV